ncbi:BSD-domain-containing protein [Trichodelitschia bisporula]|uniref:BSD-domain-containing protein n=1 Tax=Trichodelitschia bisporula TaxID=703511 RepID=A0A6G1HS68_9PEZI|nr:BSD-domain-containing protein [Trichodelitschia bisporula]
MGRVPKASRMNLMLSASVLAMDVAYDHIQEETFPEDEEGRPRANSTQQPTLNAEFQEAYKAFSNSPWGSRLGGFWGKVKEQGEHYYGEAQKEVTSASTTASKGLSELISRTRALSVASPDAPSSSTTDTIVEAPERPESLPADIVKEAEGMLARFRSEAARRLREIERAEDAADEALLRFGSNIRDFLSEAVTIAPPSAEEVDSGNSKVLFESRDADGKRVIHTTRFDAQLHVIHCSMDSFLSDPASDEYEPWTKTFDVEKQTAQIARDLEEYDELRRAMEKLVPEKVEYAQFWQRYYFLRHVIESEEKRRRELLKGAATQADEEVAWDEDSEEESDEDESEEESEEESPDPSASTTTLTKPKPAPEADADKLKPGEPRRSQDQRSQPDSDASYDLVSGAASRTAGSPRENVTQVEESDEEDWE